MILTKDDQAGNKVAQSNTSTAAGSCTDYYLVTYWSDGTKTREYLTTICTGCMITKQMSRAGGTGAATLNCPTGGGVAVSGGTNSAVNKTDPNKVLAKPCDVPFKFSVLADGRWSVSLVNTGLFVTANVTINLIYNPVTKMIDETSVTSSVTAGYFFGNYAQTKAYGPSYYGDKSYININAINTFTWPDIPGSFIVNYNMVLTLNTTTKMAHIENTDNTPFIP